MVEDRRVPVRLAAGLDHPESFILVKDGVLWQTQYPR